MGIARRKGARSTHPTQHTRPRQETGVSQSLGVLIAIVSSSLGGTAAAVTRYLVGNADPLTLAILRWGIGFVLRAADCAHSARAMAAAQRLARRRRLGNLLLRTVLHPLQHRRRLHDGGARQSRAVDLAAADHGRRRAPRHRAADRAQVRRCRHRGPRRFRGARVGPVRAPPGALARRVDHDRRGAVHGLLQRLVPPVHRTIERARLPGGRHGLPARRPLSWSAC